MAQGQLYFKHMMLNINFLEMKKDMKRKRVHETKTKRPMHNKDK